jgi:hypothetical protein
VNLKLLADHTVDLDLLPECPLVLDVGCRWFDFTRAVLKDRPGASVVACDPDPNIDEPPAEVMFMAVAIVGKARASSLYASFSNGEGNFLFDRLDPGECLTIPFCGWPVIDAKVNTVRCLTIQELRETYWDAVKLDCEGSEFEILENWPGPIAGQISVEFHDFTGPRSEGRDAYYERLWKLLPWYRVVQHDLSKKGEGIGHWDTLLVLRDEERRPGRPSHA